MDEYGDFWDFLNTLFEYQYTLNKVALNAEFGRVLYKLTNGAPAMLVSLFVETQKNVILNGQEKLDVQSFKTTFKDSFSNMIPYLDLTPKEKVPRRSKEKVLNNVANPVKANDNLFSSIAKLSDKNISTAINMLFEKINVEFIKI